MSDAADTASERQLPIGWTEPRPGAWECQEGQIRLSVRYSKATRLYTAMACSEEFFFSCSRLERLEAATAEAGRLGVLLRVRLTPPSAQAQEGIDAASPGAVCALCEGLELVECDSCDDESEGCPKCEGYGLIDCPRCDEQPSRAHGYQPDTDSAHT